MKSYTQLEDLILLYIVATVYPNRVRLMSAKNTQCFLLSRHGVGIVLILVGSVGMFTSHPCELCLAMRGGLTFCLRMF